jgi:hypothetical protein
MTTGVSAESYGDVTSRAWRGRTARRALLIAGIVAVGVYVVADLLSGLLYEGYSFADGYRVRADRGCPLRSSSTSSSTSAGPVRQPGRT